MNRNAPPGRSQSPALPPVFIRWEVSTQIDVTLTVQNFDRCVTGTHVSWLMDTGMKTELTAFERMLSGNAEFKGCARGNKPNR